MTAFEKELQLLINRFSMENGSNTPDFVLAEYMNGCLSNFNAAQKRRDAFYGMNMTGMHHAIETR